MQQAKGFLYHLLTCYEMVAIGEKKRDWQLLPFPRPKDKDQTLTGTQVLHDIQAADIWGGVPPEPIQG